MNNLNKYTIKAILDSKNKSFDLSKLSRKDLEFVCNICITEYRHIKSLYIIMQNFDKKNLTTSHN